MIFDQMSSLQTTINFMEKARLKEESLVLVFLFCLYSEIYTGDDLQQSAYKTIYQWYLTIYQKDNKEL